MKNNSKLSIILNYVGLISGILLPVIFLIAIWTDNDNIDKLLLTDLIVFITSICLYGIKCYEEDQNK